MQGIRIGHNLLFTVINNQIYLTDDIKLSNGLNFSKGKEFNISLIDSRLTLSNYMNYFYVGFKQNNGYLINGVFPNLK